MCKLCKELKLHNIHSWDISCIESFPLIDAEYLLPNPEEGIAIYNELKDSDDYIELTIEFPEMGIGKYLMSKGLSQDQIIQHYQR